ncbi:alpha/beta hydrolase [Pseudonocardia spinosispora]|uniref:alpha/beta hydrolase n=1 Tax=Pseudonocardia spinosispora TaxID=103441 RepID=UPI00041EFF9C|nr:alpha/beta hydrolase [Pseudonocardia spinosispora]
MAVSPQARQFLDLVADSPPLDTQSPEQNRADLANALPLTGTPTPVSAIREASVAGVPVRLYLPDTAPGRKLPSVVYLHGGGWVLGGGFELFDTICRDIAVHSEAAVVAVDYRLAPEHPFPAALDDALAVVTALLDGSADLGVEIDPARIAVAGDSAGGNLAVVCTHQLRAHTPRLRHQVLIYPVTDARVGRTPSYAEFGDGYFLTERDMRYFVGQYATDVDPTDPRLSPSLVEDLTGLPPATVITAEYDPLRDEGEAYAAALNAAGVDTMLRRFTGQVHAFLNMAGVIPDALSARRVIGERLRDAFAARA